MYELPSSFTQHHHLIVPSYIYSLPTPPKSLPLLQNKNKTDPTTTTLKIKLIFGESKFIERGFRVSKSKENLKTTEK
jgi:hypothetical protein